MKTFSRINLKSSWKINQRMFSNILPYKNLPYDSVEINGGDLNLGEEIFSKSLEETISEMRKLKRNAIFLNVPFSHSKYIHPASQHGFTYHHAENNLAVLKLWLPEYESRIPSYGTHTCGVGGITLYNNNKILIVKERPPHNKNWKFPGGYANLGENFGDAAIREVYEETGVKTKYNRLVAMRHSHGGQFGRSNLYVLCLLEALTTDVKVDSEIEDAKWEDITTFRSDYDLTPMVQFVTDLVIDSIKNPSSIHTFQEKQMQYQLAGQRAFKLYY